MLWVVCIPRFFPHCGSYSWVAVPAPAVIAVLSDRCSLVTVPRGRADPDNQGLRTPEKRKDPSFQTPSAAAGRSAPRPLGTATFVSMFPPRRSAVATRVSPHRAWPCTSSRCHCSLRADMIWRPSPETAFSGNSLEHRPSTWSPSRRSCSAKPSTCSASACSVASARSLEAVVHTTIATT